MLSRPNQICSYFCLSVNLFAIQSPEKLLVFMKLAKLAVGLSSKWQCESSRSTPQKVGNTNQRDVRSRAKRSTLFHYLSHSLHLFLSKSFPFSLSHSFCLSFSSCQQTHEVHTKLCWCLKVCHEIKMSQHKMLVKSRAHTHTLTHTHASSVSCAATWNKLR